MTAHVVLGTAGHIDHGKTALVRALTGTDTDRLPEEKKRGITIELGFANIELDVPSRAPSNGQVDEKVNASIIDVPGHERFVRTMAAGAGGIDLVMLVVAADDGVMPQTREHLAICRLLGVERGIIVLTKADLVDEEMVELAAEDARSAVASTFLEEAPLVVTSTQAGTGIDELKQTLATQVADLLGARSGGQQHGPAFLPVDRIFTRPGFGTVVTGTLLEGELAVGDGVEIVPGPRVEPLACTVRGLQVHGASTENTGPGTRLAINLRGAQLEDVHRGSALCRAGSRLPAQAVHVELTLLDDAPVVGENDEMSFHVGTADRLARVVPLGEKKIGPGQTDVARLVLAEPAAAYPGQRFILRKPGAMGQGTVGGGRVLDPEPSSGKGSFARWRRVARALSAAKSDEERAVALLEDARADGLTLADLARRLPSQTELESTMEALCARGDAVRMADPSGARFAGRAGVEEAAARMLEAALTFHRDHPFLGSVVVGELRTSLPKTLQGLADAAVALCEENGDLVRAGTGVRHRDHEMSAEVKAKIESLLGTLKNAGTMPPSDDELGQQVGLDAGSLRDALSDLKRTGQVLPLAPHLHFATSSVQELEAKVKAHFASGQSELTTAELKELGGGLTRKYAIPLLEHLDATGLTKRQGDVRVAGG